MENIDFWNYGWCLNTMVRCAASKKHCTENYKTYFLFPDVLKRWHFQKNCAGIWSFLYYWERSCFFFPKIWSYIWDGKWKMIFIKKSTRKYGIFFKLSEKMVFLKRAAPGHDLSCIIWKDGIFPKNAIFFPWAGSQRWPFSRNTWKYDIFCVHVWVLQTRCHASQTKKIKGGLILQNAPKGDWRSRLTSLKDLQQFSALSRRPLLVFSCFFHVRKKPRNLIYRIEVWLLIQFIRLEIFYNE